MYPRTHKIYLLISVQSSGRTRSSSVVTLARPSVSSSLQITNRSFRYASPHLWNQLPSSFCQPHCVYSPPGSPHPAHITTSQSPPSLSSSITPSSRPFIPDLMPVCFTNPFLHRLSFPTFGLPSKNFSLGPYFLGTGVCFFKFIYLFFWLRVLRLS